MEIIGMLEKPYLFVLFSLALSLVCATTEGATPFNVLDTTPVGSWQLREIVTTNHKGKQSVQQMRYALVGEENRDGKPHVWIEMRIQNYKVSRKGQRKLSGDTVIMKSLVEASLFESDMTNALANLRGAGREIIVKTGDEALRISEGGLMADMALKAFDSSISFEITNTGETATIDTPAGAFKAHKIIGTGETTMKVFMRTMKVTSTSEIWLSSDVPFGIVSSTTNSVVNGKPETSEMTLLEFGMSGATSEITGEIMDMPTFKFPGT